MARPSAKPHSNGVKVQRVRLQSALKYGYLATMFFLIGTIGLSGMLVVPLGLIGTLVAWTLMVGGFIAGMACINQARRCAVKSNSRRPELTPKSGKNSVVDTVGSELLRAAQCPVAEKDELLRAAHAEPPELSAELLRAHCSIRFASILSSNIN